MEKIGNSFLRPTGAHVAHVQFIEREFDEELEAKKNQKQQNDQLFHSHGARSDRNTLFRFLDGLGRDGQRRRIIKPQLTVVFVDFDFAAAVTHAKRALD